MGTWLFFFNAFARLGGPHNATCDAGTWDDEDFRKKNGTPFSFFFSVAMPTRFAADPKRNNKIQPN